ncbi:MAG: hypothetical protein U0Q07_14155 [Acidimicrobiales bacterium]
MPGFFDKVSKGLGDLAESVNKAVSSGGDASPASGSVAVPPPPGSVPPPPPPGVATAPTGTVAGTQPPSPFSYDEFLDGTDPASWTNTDRLADVVTYHLGRNVVFDEAQSFDREDAFVARFPATDASVTVDLVSINEDTMGALGTRDALLARYLDGVADQVAEPIDEIAVSGSLGAGHACCIDLIGDAALRVDVYAPAEVPVDQLRAVVTRVVRDAIRDP